MRYLFKSFGHLDSFRFLDIEFQEFHIYFWVLTSYQIYITFEFLSLIFQVFYHLVPINYFSRKAENEEKRGWTKKQEPEDEGPAMPHQGSEFVSCRTWWISFLRIDRASVCWDLTHLISFRKSELITRKIWNHVTLLTGCSPAVSGRLAMLTKEKDLTFKMESRTCALILISCIILVLPLGIIDFLFASL